MPIGSQSPWDKGDRFGLVNVRGTFFASSNQLFEPNHLSREGLRCGRALSTGHCHVFPPVVTCPGEKA